MTLQSGGNSLPPRFNWCKVWTGVKCNFSWAHLHRRYGVGKLLISLARIWNFTRIGRKIKKLWVLIISAQRQSHQSPLGQPKKRCELQHFLAALGQVVRRWKALDLGSLNMQFQQDGPKDKKLQLFKFFAQKLRKILLDWALIMRP